MSFGLPDFGARGKDDEHRGGWRAVQVAGLLALAYAAGVAVTEGMEASSADRSSETARADVTRLTQSAESGRRTLARHSDLLVATAGAESSPARVLADLRALLPEGVSVVSLKIEYLPDASARLELGVEARGPQAYDRFLSALSKSPHFSDIKPGSESRPGLVRATVSANHRPGAPTR